MLKWRIYTKLYVFKYRDIHINWRNCLEDLVEYVAEEQVIKGDK